MEDRQAAEPAVVRLDAEHARAEARALASKFARVRQTGRGSPVVPDVKTTAQRARRAAWLGSGGSGSAGFSGAIAVPASHAACSSTAKSMPAGVRRRVQRRQVRRRGARSLQLGVREGLPGGDDGGMPGPLARGGSQPLVQSSYRR